MDCQREQQQPPKHGNALGSGKSARTIEQGTPPESAYRLSFDSDSAAWVFRSSGTEAIGIRRSASSELGGDWLSSFLAAR